MVKFDGTSLRHVQIDLYSLKGTKVYSENLSTLSGQVEERIQLNGVSKGVYMLRITSEHGVSNTKVVVQ
jgi:hypothetical protein